MEIPRELKKVSGWLKSSYGLIPWETPVDKKKLQAIIQIYEKALKEDRIVVRKEGALPKFNGARMEERMAMQTLQNHTLRNLKHAYDEAI